MERIELDVYAARDADGWWSHPGIPDFEEDVEKYREWREEQALEISYTYLESESPDHPSYVAYFDFGNPQVRDWNPEPPRDPRGGWRVFSIHDTDYGPIFVWARRSAPAP